MASILQKLVKNQSASRIITSLDKPRPPNLIPPLLSHLRRQPRPTETESHHPHLINIIPFTGTAETESSNPSHPLQFYPSFSFGFFLNHVSSTGFDQSGADDVISCDSPMIWADSVKKKRKKKMNKHKYRKLRKRLRKHG